MSTDRTPEMNRASLAPTYQRFAAKVDALSAEVDALSAKSMQPGATAADRARYLEAQDALSAQLRIRARLKAAL